MSKYKVGDKVLIKATITEDEYGLKYPFDVTVGNHSRFNISEDDIASKTYEDGLNDAWELARKICGMTRQAWYEIFKIEDAYLADILDDNTPQEALAKIEAYEESKAIKVGDVVRSTSNPDNEYLVITNEDDESVYEYGVINLTSMIIDRITGSLSHFEKTGRHIDIQHILEQIRGNE